MPYSLIVLCLVNICQGPIPVSTDRFRYLDGCKREAEAKNSILRKVERNYEWMCVRDGRE